MSHTSDRVNKIAKIFDAKKYLEIGVRKGETFLHVDMPYKTAVDLKFCFDFKPHQTENSAYFEMSSDDFFCKISDLKRGDAFKNDESNLYFDIIYIDGLHTFEQSYRDFVNSLPFSHQNTIWIFDDTVPCDPYSAYPEQETSLKYRLAAGLKGRPWHGDVYKTIFAIHDFHPSFSYCTQIDTGNPQTIVWRSMPQERKKIFSSLDEIQKLSYFDLLDNQHLLVCLPNSLAIEMIGLAVNPQEYQKKSDFKKIIKPLAPLNANKIDSARTNETKEFIMLKQHKESLEIQNKNLKNTIEKLKLEKSELESHILKYKNSLSWRVTKWLRYF